MSKSSGVKAWAFLFGKKLSHYRCDTALTREEKQRTEKDSIPDGEAWYHKLSKDYPKYSFDETQKKLDYAKKSKKMCSCKFFRNHFTVCPVQGCNVRFPFEHARKTQ